MDGSPSKIEPNRKRQKTGGRKKGSINKATKDIKALAQPYGPEAVKTLVALMRGGESDVVRRSAATDLLDRGYGKPPQAHEHTGGLELTINGTIDAMRQRVRSLRAAG